MGIAGNYGIDSSDVEWAAEQGANYWVWGASFKKVTAGIKEVIRKNREKNVVALLGWGYFGWQIQDLGTLYSIIVKENIKLGRYLQNGPDPKNRFS